MNHQLRMGICMAFSAYFVSVGHAEVPEASVRRFIAGSHMHGIPYAPANDLGPAALPTLYAMLREDPEGPELWKIIITIGDIGSLSSFDSLRAFMWDRYKGRIGENVFSAETSALYAIGSLRGPGSDRALDYLVKGTNPKFWASLPWRYRDRGSAEIRTILANCAVGGLGLTGTAKADSILSELVAHPTTRRLVATARTAKRRNATIRRIGRREFERQIEMKSAGRTH